ncbi:MAG TPA: protein kinase [Pyrinomonadaceae bacterium]
MKQERYRIINCIEKNAGGALYEVYDNVLSRNGVLKEIPVKLKKVVTASQQEELKLAFANNAKILTEIKHESLLQVYDYFSGIDRNYLVMESVGGDDLGKLLEKNEKFSLSDILEWAEQLLDALTYLHKQSPSVIHRNVNPQNIKLTSDGKIKLLALGVAKKGEIKENSTLKNQPFDSKTLNYLPLEQIFKNLDSASQKVITKSYDEKSEMILKLPADVRSDIYAVGATLYHLLTGKPPVDSLERSIEILEGKPDPLAPANKLNSGVPLEVSDILIKAMEIKRENRFDSAIIMRQIFRTAVARLKERDAKEQKNKDEEVILEFPAETVLEEKENLVEKEKLDLEQERLKIEAEQKRQTELIKQQLRESELRRLRAEKRAEEAEKLLAEKQKKETVKIEVPANTQAPAQKADDKSSEEKKAINLDKPSVKAEIPVETHKDLFVQPKRNNKVWKQISVAALIIILLGSAAYGVWHFQILENALPDQMTQNQITNLVDKVATDPIVEAAQIPNIEPTAEPTASSPIEPAPEVKTITEPSEPVFTKLPIAKTTYKNKVTPAPVAPRIEKPAAPQTKPVSPEPKPKPKKEKTVTVDDLISGN